MPVHTVRAACKLFNRACEQKLFPFLERAYGERMGAKAGRIRVWDAFVVRYDARAQRSLPTHADDSHLSLTIALNATDEYEGGGTSFESPLAAGDDDDAQVELLRPEKGHVVAFPGELRHGGSPVTEGVRYIIAAFLWISTDE